MADVAAAAGGARGREAASWWNPRVRVDAAGVSCAASFVAVASLGLPRLVRPRLSLLDGSATLLLDVATARLPH